jgi:ATP-dependent RNA helicase DBP3
MFTATWGEEVQKLSKKFMKKQRVMAFVGKDPNEEDQLTANTQITQIVDVIKEGNFQKAKKLDEYLAKLTKSGAFKIIVFALYKAEASRLETTLKGKGWNVLC